MVCLKNYPAVPAASVRYSGVVPLLRNTGTLPENNGVLAFPPTLPVQGHRPYHSSILFSRVMLQQKGKNSREHVAGFGRTRYGTSSDVEITYAHLFFIWCNKLAQPSCLVDDISCAGGGKGGNTNWYIQFTAWRRSKPL